MTLGERLRELRLERGMSKTEVAMLAETSRSAVQRIEDQERLFPSVWLVARLARALSTNLDVLIEDVDWPAPKAYHDKTLR